MKQFYGYIRVSTVKQGQQGVSLQEQRDAISRYASRNGLEIVSWFEEQETAAKCGRPVFNRMLKLLRQEKASGIVLHKIDRGARNLKDWADIGDLSDAGIQVHFANESLDLHSRGGRLSADIQAVVATDYIRNLREETLKGFLGRLKQGVYPLPAPLGYVNTGKGKPKELNPITAPLVRKAFELYATGRHSFDTLAPELYRLGLRNRNDGKVTRNGLSTLLKNQFYIGLMHLKSTGQVFEGRHTPLVSKSMFDRVQLILSGKTNTRVAKHDFLFRRLLCCKQCGYTLIGEKQKGHDYYRCHTNDCPVTGIREEVVEEAIQAQLKPLCFNDEARDYFRAKIIELKADWVSREEEMRVAIKLKLDQITTRLNRLTDAFLDGSIERDIFEQRKATLIMEKKDVLQNLATLNDQNHLLPDRLAEFLELAGNAWLSYKLGCPEEKRDLLKKLTSNRQLDGKHVEVKLSFPYNEIANNTSVPLGDPQRDIPRTWDRLLNLLSDNNTTDALSRVLSRADQDCP